MVWLTACSLPSISIWAYWTLIMYQTLSLVKLIQKRLTASARLLPCWLCVEELLFPHSSRSGSSSSLKQPASTGAMTALFLTINSEIMQSEKWACPPLWLLWRLLSSQLWWKGPQHGSLCLPLIRPSDNPQTGSFCQWPHGSCAWHQHIFVCKQRTFDMKTASMGTLRETTKIAIIALLSEDVPHSLAAFSCDSQALILILCQSWKWHIGLERALWKCLCRQSRLSTELNCSRPICILRRNSFGSPSTFLSLLLLHILCHHHITKWILCITKLILEIFPLNFIDIICALFTHDCLTFVSR